MALATALLATSLGVAVAATVDNIVPTGNYNFACFNSTQANPNSVCRTDNASTGWWLERSLDTTTATDDTTAERNINVVMSSSYGNGTDLTTFYDSSPVFSGLGETDVVYRSFEDAFDGTGFVGYTWCDDKAGGSTYECDQQYVNFKFPTAKRSLVCHETGHAVGLLHGRNASLDVANNKSYLGCMENPIDESNYFLGQNNVDNINSVY